MPGTKERALWACALSQGAACMWPWRCPVYRWRELVAGAGREGENLSSRCWGPVTAVWSPKGRTPSGHTTEGQSTDARHRGGPARRSAGIKTGMEEEMEELYIEGLANHDDPGHALSLARVTAKRWTGARAGRAIEPRNHRVRGADVVYGNGRQHCQQRYRELLVGPARSENHGMHGTSMRENREVSCSPAWLITGRAAQGRSRPHA
jgi:hypothetical protein